jgi:predicted deacetylase
MNLNKKYTFMTIRLDDICPALDWEKFNKIYNVLDKYSLKPCIGVVPENKDENLNRNEDNPNFWLLIKGLSDSGWIIAQHGYTHRYTTSEAGILHINRFSEFAGISYERQLDMLKRGKDILHSHGIESKVFMAPAHSFDKNTLRALIELGFEYVTDGRSSYPYDYYGLRFIPCRHSEPILAKGIVTCCFHINSMTDKMFEQLDEFLAKESEKIIDFSDAMQLTPRSRFYAKCEENNDYMMRALIKPLLRPVYNKLKK